MSQFTGYQPAFAHVAGPYVAGEMDEAAWEASEPTMPSLVGVALAFYMLSVITMSTASESVSWIPQVIGIVVGLLWIVVGLFVKGQSIAWVAPMTFFLGFNAWTATGYLATAEVEYFQGIFLTSLKVAIMAFIALQCVRTRKDFLACCLFIGIGGIVILVAGFDKIMTAIQFTGGREKVGARASGTLISNSNDLGQLGVLVGFTAVSCMLGYKNTLIRIFAGLPLIVSLYIIASSGSRMAMLATAAVAVGIYWYHFRKIGGNDMARKIFVSVMALALLGGTLYYIKNLPFLFRLLDVFSSSEKMQEEPRFQYFLKALGSCAEHPIFGLGSGGFALNRLGTNADGSAHYSHSTVSETLSCNGLPGFLLYFGSRATFFLLLRKTQRLQLPSKDRAVVATMQALCFSILVFDIVAVTFQDRLMWPMIGAACGYLWNLNKLYGHTEHYPAYG